MLENLMYKIKEWVISEGIKLVVGLIVLYFVQIDLPMLMIDDEADNASVNTKGNDDPTAINRNIRKILPDLKCCCHAVGIGNAIDHKGCFRNGEITKKKYIISNISGGFRRYRHIQAGGPKDLAGGSQHFQCIRLGGQIPLCLIIRNIPANRRT